MTDRKPLLDWIAEERKSKAELINWWENINKKPEDLIMAKWARSRLAELAVLKAAHLMAQEGGRHRTIQLRAALDALQEQIER